MNSHTPTTWWVILRHKGKKQTKKHTVSPYQRKKSVERRRCVCMLVWTRRTGLPWLRTCNMTVPLCRASSHVKTLKSTSSRKSFLPDVTVRPKDMIPTNVCQEQPRLPLRFLFFYRWPSPCGGAWWQPRRSRPRRTRGGWWSSTALAFER